MLRFTWVASGGRAHQGRWLTDDDAQQGDDDAPVHTRTTDLDGRRAGELPPARCRTPPRRRRRRTDESRTSAPDTVDRRAAVRPALAGYATVAGRSRPTMARAR